MSEEGSPLSRDEWDRRWGIVGAAPQSRPHLGDDPAGHTCDNCGEREATMIWGDLMTVNHGGGQWRCDVCALTEQLAFARERAAAIPELERQLREATSRLPNHGAQRSGALSPNPESEDA